MSAGTLGSTSTAVYGNGGGSPDTAGNAATSYVGFYGTAPIVQRSGSAQSAIVVTVTQTGFGLTTSAGMNALVAQVQEIAATLTALGIWKGSA